MKHTKGQWVQNHYQGTPDSGYIGIENEEGDEIGQVYTIHNKKAFPDAVERANSNANLITSAPEMLTFLKEIAHGDKLWRSMNPKSNQGRYDIKLIDKVNYLIAKAEGGE